MPRTIYPLPPSPRKILLEQSLHTTRIYIRTLARARLFKSVYILIILCQLGTLVHASYKSGQRNKFDNNSKSIKATHVHTWGRPTAVLVVGLEEGEPCYKNIRLTKQANKLALASECVRD